MSKTRATSSRRHRAPRGPATPKVWQLQDAKARFSEVFRLARENGPQRVTKHDSSPGSLSICAFGFKTGF